MIKYQFIDGYYTDENYIKLLQKRSHLLEEIIELRESILKSDIISQEEKQSALQMIEVLISDSKEVVNTMAKGGFGFIWFKIKRKHGVEQLVLNYNSIHFYTNPN